MQIIDKKKYLKETMEVLEMNCPNCGKELAPGDKFCMGCGAKVDGTEAGTGAGASNNAAPSLDAINAFAGAFMGTSSRGVNFMVRRYFFGFGDFIGLSIILWVVFGFLKMVAGGASYMNPYGGYGYGNSGSGFSSFCGVVQIVAIIILVVSIALDIYFRVVGMGKANVDAATQNGIETLKARASEKFNVDSEQLCEVDPIVVAGPGNSPHQDLLRLTGKNFFFSFNLGF